MQRERLVPGEPRIGSDAVPSRCRGGRAAGGVGGASAFPAPDTCNASGSCQVNHASAATLCRADAGECDIAETCDGAGSCPADGFEAAGTSCGDPSRSEEHTSELQSQSNLVCRLLLLK